MQNSKFLWIAALATSALLAACGGSDPPPPTVAATEDLKVATTASTATALSGSTFSYANGVPAFGTTGTTTLKVSAPASGTPTFNIASGGGTATGNLGFGSCIFTIVTSSIPSLPVGTVVTVEPCTITVGTAGDAAGSGQKPVTLTLGTAVPAPVALTVSINAAGDVTIVSVEGVSVDAGTVTTSPVTGGG